MSIAIAAVLFSALRAALRAPWFRDLCLLFLSAMIELLQKEKQENPSKELAALIALKLGYRPVDVRRMKAAHKAWRTCKRRAYRSKLLFK